MISVGVTAYHFHPLSEFRFAGRALVVVHPLQVLEILGDATRITVVHIDTVAGVQRQNLIDLLALVKIECDFIFAIQFANY